MGLKKTYDVVTQFPGLLIIHQKIPSHEVGRHEHAEHEFFLPLQGEIKISWGKTSISAGPGRMLYVPPDLDHSFSSSAQGSGERLIWLIDKNLFQKHSRKKFAPVVMAADTLARELLFYLLLRPKTPGAKHFVLALLASLIENLESTHLQERDLALEHLSGKCIDPRVQKALEILSETGANPPLPEVARLSGQSLRNFNRLFLKETGMNPKDFILLKRIKAAKNLLLSTRLSVTEIGLEVGYNSISKFIEAFKRLEGTLPSTYRAEFQSKKT